MVITYSIQNKSYNNSIDKLTILFTPYKTRVTTISEKMWVYIFELFTLYKIRVTTIGVLLSYAR